MLRLSLGVRGMEQALCMIRGSYFALQDLSASGLSAVGHVAQAMSRQTVSADESATETVSEQ